MRDFLLLLTGALSACLGSGFAQWLIFKRDQRRAREHIEWEKRLTQAPPAGDARSLG